MRKFLMVAALVALVAVPAALADANPQAPGAYCVAHPELIGTGKTYPTMKACVKAQTALNDQNVVNAAKDCIAERDASNFASTHGGKTFDQYYGTGKKERNPFANCVAIVAKANRQAEQQMAHQQRGLVIGGMGELRCADNVADGVDATVGGA